MPNRRLLLVFAGADDSSVIALTAAQAEDFHLRLPEFMRTGAVVAIDSQGDGPGTWVNFSQVAMARIENLPKTQVW